MAFAINEFFLLVEGEIAAHHALQLGELSHHVADEIGLGEVRGPLGEVRIGADELGDLPRKHAYPLHPLILCAELFLEHDLAELRHALFEHHLAVVVEEEFSVGELQRSPAHCRRRWHGRGPWQLDWRP